MVPALGAFMDKLNEESTREERPKSASKACPSAEISTLSWCAKSMLSHIGTSSQHTYSFEITMKDLGIMSVEVTQSTCNFFELGYNEVEA